MVESGPMYKCAILLVLIAFDAILSAEGRQIMNKNEASAVKKESQRETAKQGGSSINMHQSTAGLKEDFHTTQSSGHISARGEVSVAAKKEIFPPMSFGDSAAVYKNDFRPTIPGSQNDFRPTVPGHGRGVGHNFSNKSAEPKA